MRGQIHSALRYLCDDNGGGVLPLSDDVMRQLMEKHPEAQEARLGSLLFGPVEDIPDTVFLEIDGEVVRDAALRTKGSGGPSGVDANGFRRLLACKSFKKSGTDLCNAVAVMARRLCTEYVDPISIEAVLSNRLIPLDKGEGAVRPIGVGEVLRRIIGKCVTKVIKSDVIEASGSLQVCAGLKSGNEAAIHAMRNIYEADETDAVLLIDASNAFNALNRSAALHNIRVLCPTVAIYAINTYRQPARLFVLGGQELRSAEGHKHLGAVLGSRSFLEEYVGEKVEDWVHQVSKLAEFAISQPQASYAAFTVGLRHRWTYFLRTLPDITDLLAPLERAITEVLIPAITDHQVSTDERSLLALPVRMGGLGLANPSESSSLEYEASVTVTEPLVQRIVAQNHQPPDAADMRSAISHAGAKKNEFLKGREETVKNSLSPRSLRAAELASEKGAPSWLTVIPKKDQGYDLNKREFRDAVKMRYNWEISDLPKSCVCGDIFDIDHAMICKRGGFIIQRHNELRDLEADLLSTVCNDVEVEPVLQQITGETLNRGANRAPDARLDIHARGFWERQRSSFFDVRVCHPNADSYLEQNPEQIYRQHESEKKRQYADRVMEVEQGTFTPLIFSSTGGMGTECKIYHKRLVELLSTKKGESYANTMLWVRARVSFALIRSALLCLRGSRSIRRTQDTNNVDIAIDNATARLT
ncbi:hypothetical protein ACROYT_G032751 [Oculina patagonica]